MKLEPVTLTGTRVRLEPLKLRHAVGLYDAGNDPRVWVHLPYAIERRHHAEHFAAAALEGQERRGELPFAVIDLTSNKLVGSTRFMAVVPEHRRLEIGWTWYAPEVWGSGVNTECKYLLLTHCFETLGTVRVELKTDILNERSQRAIERIGATREGVFRKHLQRRDGTWRDSVYFSVIDDEWMRVKAHLEGLLAI
ncbi:MAG: GNAT family N-acetyltransferase [Chrysiogenetes bacterium]|nr:GNAT family N-acetyltransferase [Chrysiogenetes bacterium]